MSYSEYKDFAKDAKEAHLEDYDTDSSVRINAGCPYGVSLNTTTAINPGSVGTFPTVLNAQWAHPSGFSVDSLEVSSCDKIAIATSLANLAPGLTLKFNGNKAGDGSLGAVYTHKLATLAADMDLSAFSTVNASILGGAQGVQVGAAASLGVKGGVQVLDYSAALAWAPKEGTFAGLQVNNKLSNLLATVQHRVQPNLSLNAMADFAIKTSATKVSVGGTFDCCKHCVIKMKVDNEGLINAAVKREFPGKKFTLASAAAVNAKNLQSYSFGVTATVG